MQKKLGDGGEFKVVAVKHSKDGGGQRSGWI